MRRLLVRLGVGIGLLTATLSAQAPVQAPALRPTRLLRVQQLAMVAYPELRTQGLQLRVDGADGARVTFGVAEHDRDDVLGLSRPRAAQLVVQGTFDGTDALTGATLSGPLTHAAERRRIRALASGWTEALQADGAGYAPDQRAALLRDLNLPALQKVLGSLTATGATFQGGAAEDGLYWEVTATSASGTPVTLGFEPYQGRLVRVGGGQ